MEENSYKKSLWRVSPSYSPPSFFVHLVYEFLHKNFINFHKYIQYTEPKLLRNTLILISLKNVNTFKHKAWNFVQFFFDLEYFWYILKNLIKLFFQYILHNTYMSKAKFFDKFQTFLEAKLCFIQELIIKTFLDLKNWAQNPHNHWLLLTSSLKHCLTLCLT